MEIFLKAGNQKIASKEGNCANGFRDRQSCGLQKILLRMQKGYEHCHTATA